MSYYAALQNLSLEDDPREVAEPPVDVGKASEQPQPRQNGAAEPAASRSYAAAAGASAAAAAASKAAREDAADADTAQLPPQTLMQNALIWIDLEMTGLDLHGRDTIIEIAVIVTDSHLREEIMGGKSNDYLNTQGPDLAIHHADAVLDGMNEWSMEHHGASGLTERCRASTISMQEAEEQVLNFVQRYTDGSTRHHLAGSSVHVDLAFLRKDMPRLAAHLPYRVVDVSTVMELCRRWFPKEYAKTPRKQTAHTAKSDIQDSIRQLRYYRRAIFKSHAHSPQ